MTICSLAKRNEEIYVQGSNKPLNTEKSQPGLILIRRLRDEAHRFAVGFHRQQRSARMTSSNLRDIPGLGPKRIRLLLDHFNSIDALKIASLDQLTKVPGMGENTANEIHNYFNKRDFS